MLQPTDTILYIELPNISTLLDHTESCLGVFHFNWLAKKFCLISNRANIIGCWVFASSCLGWDITITSLILRFHDDSQIPWWQPDYYFCFYSTVFFCLLACVASVSSRVRARNFLFFALVPVFSTNSRGTACYAGYLFTESITSLNGVSNNLKMFVYT